MEVIRIQDCLSFGWSTFKQRPGLFIGAALVLFGVSLAIGISEGVLEMLVGKDAMKVIEIVISLIMNVFTGMGVTALYLRAHDDVATARIADLWQPKFFWPFLALSILMFVAVVLGLIALIIPGIIISLALALAGQLMIDRGLGPIEALKESARLTKGHRLSLLWLGLASALLNIVGILALLVGLFVTVPVTMLAFVHAYRQLSGGATDAESVVVPEPEPVPALA